MLADWLVSQPSTTLTRWLGILLYFVYALPLLGPFARWTHVQLSVVAMAATLYVIWQICRGLELPSSNRVDAARIMETA
jgi:hypothetical protein